MKSIRTACPRNCYSTCTFMVDVEDNNILRIYPDPLNKAVPEGPCLKGLAYLERAHSPDRICSPLKKQGLTHVPVSWEEALDEIADKIRQFIKEYGSQSILFFATSGMSGLMNEVSSVFWKSLGGVTTTYGNLCWPAGLEATRLTLGANKHSAPWDLAHSRLIIYWGKNPAETNVQEIGHLMKARETGAEVVVIDPRYTPTAEKATTFLQITPGTDGALALGVAHLLCRNDHIDLEFIQEYVQGFEAFRESLDAYTPENTSRLTGIPVEGIHYLAQVIGSLKPMSIIPGYGMQRWTNGGQTIRCILALQVITGNLGKPGASWRYANLQSYVFDELKEPETYYPSSGDSPNRRSVSMARLGADMLQQEGPELKMAWVERGNPLSQSPQTRVVREAFRKLEYRVVVEQFMTDTAREADLILPAKNMFEQSDVIGSYWSPYVALKPKVLDPPPKVKTEAEIYYLLAQQLGKFELIERGLIPEPEDEAVVSYLKKRIQTYGKISWEDLERGPVLPPDLEEVAFEDLVFPTTSGKIELQSRKATELWFVDELPTYIRPREHKMTRGTGFKMLTPNTKNRIHSQFGNLKMIREYDPEPALDIHPQDALLQEMTEGEKVAVYNGRGTIYVRLRFTEGIKKGCVSLTNGWWKADGVCGNTLSMGRETDMGFGAAFHDNTVFLHKVRRWKL